MEQAEHDEHDHCASGDERDDGGDPGDAPDRRPGERRQQQAAERLTTEQRVRWPVSSSTVPCSSAIVASSSPASWAAASASRASLCGPPSSA